ncbi:MAG TPA: efflux RND transporter periplasmic adaptor subunit, partial [Usitatibacter sp.]|nr:efflux RND transporter periplasmic adaptor subunit [Usitatibacter sp.]
MRRLAAGALCAALALAGCGEKAAEVSGRAEPSALRTAPVELRDVDLTLSAEAVVEAVRQSTVSAQVAGRIVDIRFDVGDRVQKGDVIVRIDERAASQALAASEAQLRAAEANLAHARAELERSRSLLAQRFISQAAYDKAENEFKAAEQQMKAMFAGAGQAATERSFATIVAPYGGVVAARHVQLGEMATPGKPLMTGFDPSTLRVVATVASSHVAAIQAGARARVEVPSAGKWMEARSITVVPSADPRTHSTQVRIDLPADAAGIYPG